MRPLTLRLSGWGPYKEEQFIDFEKLSGRGLFLVHGDTGAGKTTVFDAITFALFGDLSGMLREKSSVRSDFADSSTKTFVELVMSHRGETYRLYRTPEYMRPKKKKAGDGKAVKEKETALLTLPDNRVVEGTASVTKKIEEILSMDVRQFRQISMIAQGEFAKLLTASPKEKTQIFRDIFDTCFYERFAGILHKKAVDLYNGLETLRHKMEEDVDSLACEEKEWQALKEEESLPVAALINFLKEKEKGEKKQVSALKEKLEETERHLEEKTAQLNELTALTRLYEEKDRLHKIIEETVSFYEKKEELSEFLEAGREECLQRTYVQRAVLQNKRAEKEKECAIASYLEAEEEWKEKKKRYEDAQSVYRSSIIGIAAGMLKEGEPCPVCGSLHHPHAAQKAENLPDEKAMNRMKKETSEAQMLMTDTFGRAAAAKQNLERWKKEKEEAETEFFKRQEVRSQKEALCGKDILKRLLGRGGADSLEEESLKRAKTELDHSIMRYGQAKAMFREKQAAVAETLKRLKMKETGETISVFEKEKILREEKNALHEKKKMLQDEQKKREWLYLGAVRVRKALEEKEKQMEELKEAYGAVKDLDNLTAGYNSRKLVFEQYVLAGCFEEILRAANVRLKKMTDDRYALFRVEEVGDGRTRDNLEIQVMDYYTGKYRSVKTLSGGELFKASLALALGLSDVVQEQKGGIMADCLFVDEGFGALDSESLEQACRTLISLASRRCMIGIISHVPELKEKIDNRLMVVRTGQGSYLRQEIS